MTSIEKRKSPPREDVCRSVAFTLARDEAQDDGLTFAGYGAVFNSPTRIDSWEGTFDEVIAPGAFRKSLKDRTPKFQFDHGHHSLIGSVPIGVIEEIYEDERGLYVSARLGRHILIDLIREAIATGAIDGMSFRFSVVRDEWRDAEGKIVKPEDIEDALWTGSRGVLLRTLKEVKVAEVGPVVWPAYPDTTASVRSIEIDVDRLNEPEQRKRLGELLLRADAADSAPQRGESDDEPQDTPGGAVEHSDEDNGEPQSTSPEAGEHPLESETDDHPDDPAAAARAALSDKLFDDAYELVRLTRESTPPMKGMN